MLSSGPHQQVVGASSNRPLERGDVIIAESTPAYDGQFGQICRSASVGAPSDVLVAKYALLVRTMAQDARQTGVSGQCSKILANA